MAEKSDKKQQPPETLAADPRYPIEELSVNAEALFSVRPEVLAGALYGNGQRELTIDEAKKAIDQFLKRKVK
ncbi:hypothetical protein ABEV00_21850 [Paenibacillus thiaminolyticus]|uniref:hypothetical protein n=1 Tax=Paenibacillus thiaminolyticus TaxID=49283 RepID=UPI003D26DE57